MDMMLFNKPGYWAVNFLMILVFAIFLYPPVAEAEPELVGEAAALIDGRNGQFLFEKNSDQRMYPASTTKILTAIIALEKGKLNDPVCIPYAACGVEGSAIGLQEGENIALEDLLYALMLNSGNDTAVAIANHIGGSVEDFVRMMNDLAKTIGAKDSNFKNPNGLPDPDHYSTARDMALIAHYAMQNPEFRKVVSTRSKTIQREVPGAQIFLENHNKLLWKYDNAIGIKTGYTNDARQCLVSAASRQNRELISVVFKSEGNDIWNDSTALLDYGFNEFTCLCLIEAGEYVEDIPVRYGVEEKIPVQTGYSLTYNMPVNSREKIRQEVFLENSIVAPVDAGAKMGELLFFAGDQELGKVDLLAQEGTELKKIARWRPYLILGLGLVILLFLIRRHNLSRRKRWQRYKEKNNSIGKNF
jgi:D-alanyl-D-alanine carboxypeptidase (penicillin-binding protein 5/6)